MIPTSSPPSLEELAPIATVDLSQRLSPLLRLHSVLLIILAALAPFFLFAVLRGLSNDSEADHRLAPTFALTHAYHVYYPPESGPVLSTLYGPVTALTYLPATLASTPTGAILIGTLWAMTIFFATAFITVRGMAGRTWMKWWQLIALTAGVVWLIGPVERTAAHIHADAPALGCAAIAALFATRQRYTFAAWANVLLSALFAVLSVFAKQNMVPLLIALVVWFAICAGRKAVLLFAGASVIFSGLMIAIAVTLLGSPAAFYFNCVYMPLHQPFDRTLLFAAINELTVISLALLLIPIMRILQSWTHFELNVGEFVVEQKTPLLILIGILMTPAAIMGRMKVGGNENSLGLALFFFVLAVLVEISALRAQNFAELLSANEIKLWSLPLLIACIVSLLSAVYSTIKSRPPSPIQQAFVYARQHPGKAYFPQFPLVHLMAEGKLYHFSWGLTDRRNAGVPVSATHYEANIPNAAGVIAVTTLVPQFETDMLSRQGPALTNFGDAAQLPQFRFYELRRAVAK
jgi:hypothetical protein